MDEEETPEQQSNQPVEVNTENEDIAEVADLAKEREIESEIVLNLNKKNFITLSDKNIENLIPYLCASDMYVGNDSFGSHITSQSGKKSIVMLLDAPRAYTDYSQNYYQMVPNGFDINEITHGTNADPNLITVEEVIKTINQFRN